LAPTASRAVASSDDIGLAVWSTKHQFFSRRSYGASNGRTLCVAVTPDGRKGVVGSERGSVSIWDLEDGTSVEMPNAKKSAVLCVAITPDGKRVISGSADGTVCVWPVESRGVAVLRKHTAAVRGVAISSKGDRAVSASSDKTLCVWDLPDSEQPTENTLLEGHEDEVKSVAMTPDGMIVV